MNIVQKAVCMRSTARLWCLYRTLSFNNATLHPHHHTSQPVFGKPTRALFLLASFKCDKVFQKRSLSLLSENQKAIFTNQKTMKRPAGCWIESYTNIISQLSGSWNWAWLGIPSEPPRNKTAKSFRIWLAPKIRKNYFCIYIKGKLLRQVQESRQHRIKC